MAGLRRSIPMAELREKMKPEEQERHATEYQGSRGGWYPPTDKPVPGTPQQQPQE
ncbi:hypothetical protein ACIQPP_05500 [Streptomyces violaceusniger]|uniref:hypothetical protein n=1 Tax=Streptomyces violaceusniger TaxID=68280 RepID=UPI0009C21750|nr:hypothetical protein [Streptomyces hygroscopicus]AQW55276.1 hypothetical protein SHXM_08739 [Streptomyces hygroscopicus]